MALLLLFWGEILRISSTTVKQLQKTFCQSLEPIIADPEHKRRHASALRGRGFWQEKCQNCCHRISAHM